MHNMLLLVNKTTIQHTSLGTVACGIESANTRQIIVYTIHMSLQPNVNGPKSDRHGGKSDMLSRQQIATTDADLIVDNTK